MPRSSPKPPYRYAVGIDLGTTNTAVAYLDLRAGQAIRLFEIPQLVAPGEVAARPGLPSFLYLPGPHDLPPGSTALPWDAGRDYAVGEMAREQGARVSGRLVASAKSWLCHARVDRTAAILPWEAPRGAAQVSPVEATRRYLQHLREAWNARMDAPFEDQLLLLTVPASFDEVARELTVRAAHEAGLPHVVLLEEPLAAFYAWLSAHEDTWQDTMAAGQLVLVCDVGGGTTDFSIIGVERGEAGLRFNRLAVGDHLMLGGDNMDHTLARHLEARLAGAPGKLDARRWQHLVQACRRAKETLLADAAPEQVDVTVVGTAGRLIAGTLKGTLTQDDVRHLLLDGFFPDVPLDDAPTERPRTGLTELGLPYVHDPAVTRHLAQFWRRFEPYLHETTGRPAVFPDYVLFNGGALTPATLRERLTELVGAWFGPVAGDAWRPVVLANPRLDLAVARGAAYYGRVRQGAGVKVGSGSPRAYYVAVGTPDDDTPDDGGHTAVCLAPRGMEEGVIIRLDEPPFEARTNQPVAFKVFASNTRLGDRPGDVVRLTEAESIPLPPIQTVLRYGKKGIVDRLPVRLSVHLTEVGTLALWCHAVQTGHRWQLQFDVRGEAETPPPVVEETVDETLLETAGAVLRQVFSEQSLAPEALRKALEHRLERPREDWPVSVLRRLADALFDLPREASPRHEARWFNLLGYCLRPGFGDLADGLRMDRAWKLFLEGPRFSGEVQCRSEWWVFWRRIAGGLSAARQAQVYHELRPFLQPRVRTKKTSRLLPQQPASRERLEIWMALAGFERLPAETRATLGRLLLEAFREGRPHKLAWWALGRLGARHPAYGPLDSLVPPAEVAFWLKTLFATRLERKDYVGNALVHLARYTGDRTRDVPEEYRNRVARWLRRLPEGEALRTYLLDPAPAHTREEEAWMFGEALPTGLLLTPHEA